MSDAVLSGGMDGCVNEETAVQLLRALEATSTALGAIKSVSGALDSFGNSNVLEIRLELQHLCRRLSNMCLLHGVSPVAVEKLRTGSMK
jgi:hypothetical protein